MKRKKSSTSITEEVITDFGRSMLLNQGKRTIFGRNLFIPRRNVVGNLEPQ